MISVSEVASPLPASLVAVIRQPTARPRSAATSVYVADVAPAITMPLRSHAYVSVFGELRNPPLMQLSCEPTVGVPTSDGGLTATGDCGPASPSSTLSCSVRVDLLPALSTASAVSVTRLPTAEAGGV